jgi:uncharacterized MAPEG superfamily protein
METIYSKLDFDNPLFDSILMFCAITIIQYLETIYDEKKTVSLKVSFVAAVIVFLIVYYIDNKYMKTNIGTQEIFTDMGAFN